MTKKTTLSQTVEAQTVEPQIAEMGAQPPRAADKIRATARDLFYRQGIRAVGVDEIVQRAGVTKPSLYRSFASKDELAASYMRDYEVEFWKRFDGAAEVHQGDPRRQILAYLKGLADRATCDGFRGCGLTNAVVEYPDSDHPARLVAQSNKIALRKRLRALAVEMGADAPNQLGDGLLLLIEGALVTGQIFGKAGPAAVMAVAAEALIDAHVKPAKRKAAK